MSINRRVFSKIKNKLDAWKKDLLIPCENKWPIDKRVEGAMSKYKHNMGYAFNITNPVLFTEKIQWYRLFYSRPDLVNVVDKFLFKSYISEKLGDGYTIPLYGAWDSITKLRKAWNTLPNEFVLKSTIQSDGKYIKIIHDKNLEDFNKLAKELREWLKPRNTLINSFCRAYYEAVPRILAEKYESQVDDQLYDYKFFCFDGIPYCIYAVTDHFPGQLSHISFYDLEWNRLNVKYGKHPLSDVPKPKHFDEMLDISRKLSGGFPFVRVDFFDVGENVFISEMTLYPGAGVVPYYPESFNRELGDRFHLENCQSELYDGYISIISHL